MEREPHKEIIRRGDLFFLWHPGTEDIFSGYGLTIRDGRNELLIGLLMIDRPAPVNQEWLDRIGETFGEYQLVAMTRTGERGIVCQMAIDEGSLAHLRQFPSSQSEAIQQALTPLLEQRPKPLFRLHWDEERRLWASEFVLGVEVPEEIKQIFRRFGPTCFATESSLGIVFLAHAADSDMEGFWGKPVLSQWQLGLLPTAPIIRLHLTILDQPANPFHFDTYFNIERPEDSRMLSELIKQESVMISFLGDDLEHCFTKFLPFPEQNKQELHQLIVLAIEHLGTIPVEKRDFDRAKAEFQRRYGL